jgi:hypothetical protein
LGTLAQLATGPVDPVNPSFGYYTEWKSHPHYITFFISILGTKPLDTFLLINLHIPPCGSDKIRIDTEHGAKKD